MFENSWSTDVSEERRKEPRYNVEVDIIVFSGKNFFRTKTIDLSANGCRLLDPIPEHFDQNNLEIVISGSDDGRQSFQMVKGSLIGESRARLTLKTNFNSCPV